MWNGSEIQKGRTPAQESQVRAEETTARMAYGHMTVWHYLECLDMAPDPLFLLQIVCRRKPKLHWKKLNVIFTYKIKKMYLCSLESDAYRQLLSNFLLLEFQTKYSTADSLTWDKLVWERSGTDELPQAILSYHSKSYHNPPESTICYGLFKGFTGAVIYLSSVFTPPSWIFL